MGNIMSISINGETGISTNGVQWMTGMILPFGNETAPDGWLSCDGEAVSRETYARLFAAIGTKWGAGDGSTTFNVPDLRGAFVRGTGTSPTATKNGGSVFYEGPTVGASQRDQMQRITGSTTSQSDTSMLFDSPVQSGAFGKAEDGLTNVPGFLSASTGNALTFNSADSPDARTSATTDGETRVFNLGVLYCIKE
jgi:microcystin-dependent protein